MNLLLQNDYLEHFGLTEQNYQVSVNSSIGLLALYDDKACSPCLSNGVNVCDSLSVRQNMLVHSDVEVTCINIEGFLSQFNGHIAGTKSKCDYLLYGGAKVAFIDLYCGLTKYLSPYVTTHSNGHIENKPGKLAHVRQQISTTIDNLYEVPSIAARLDSFVDRIGIFAYRKKDFFTNDGSSEEKSMEVFIDMANETSKSYYTHLSHGFRFIGVVYPQVYEW